MFGLFPRKGTIAVGSDADIVVFDPKKKQTLGVKTLHMRVDYNPYEGTKVEGAPTFVVSQGNVIIEGTSSSARKAPAASSSAARAWRLPGCDDYEAQNELDGSPTAASSCAIARASRRARSTTTTSRRCRSRSATGRPTTTRRCGSPWRTASPTYMLASGLMASGMNWWQALVTILLGNTIVLVPILLNSHPGTKYGIPFPVFARAAYGTIGSNLPALMRALVACGWFGIQAWIGGEALNTFFANVIPGWPTLLGAGLRRPHDDRVAVVPALLGPQHLHHLSRHGPAAGRRELGGAVRARDDRGAPRLGDLARARPRAAARGAGQVHHRRASSFRSSCRRSPR